jgi:hypothetical protein
MDSKKQKNKINFRKKNHEINARGWQGKVAATKEAHGNGAGNYSRVLPRGEVYVPRSTKADKHRQKNPARIGPTGGFTKPAKLVPTGFAGPNDIVNSGLGWTEKKDSSDPGDTARDGERIIVGRA